MKEWVYIYWGSADYQSIELIILDLPYLAAGYVLENAGSTWGGAEAEAPEAATISTPRDR